MDARYVRDTLGKTLTRACGLLAQYQPEDPIEWLATYLRHDVTHQELAETRLRDQKERERVLEAYREEEERLKILKVILMNPFLDASS